MEKTSDGLRYEIGIVLLAVLWSIVPWTRTPGGGYAPLLSWLGVWYLIVRVIQTDTLPGDREFWLTRPYSRASLLAAKAMFIASFAILPMSLFDAAIVDRAGFAISDHWAGLVWEQLLRTMALYVPFAVVGAITASISDAVLGVLLILIAYLEWLGALGPRAWRAEGSVLIGLVALCGITVILWQYATRRSWVGRSMVAGAILLLGVASLPTRSADRASVGHQNIRVTLGRPLPPTDEPSPPGIVRARLPFTLHGLPEGDRIAVVADETIADVDGHKESSHFYELSEASHGEAHLVQALTIAGHPQRTLPASTHLVLQLRVFGNPQTYPVPDQQTFSIPGIGVCSEGLFAGGLTCVSAFRLPSAIFIGEADMQGLTFSSSPYPAELALTPLFRTGHRWAPLESGVAMPDHRTLIVGNPAGELHAEFDEDVELADYVDR